MTTVGNIDCQERSGCPEKSKSEEPISEERETLRRKIEKRNAQALDESRRKERNSADGDEDESESRELPIFESGGGNIKYFNEAARVQESPLTYAFSGLLRHQ